MRRFALSSPFAAFSLVLFGIATVFAGSARATPLVPDFSDGPVVFDFEDGLQGWTLEGSAQRVNTQVLGGEWAIFGDGSARSTGVLRDVDLAGVAAIRVEQLCVTESGGPCTFLTLPLSLGLLIVGPGIAVPKVVEFPFEIDPVAGQPMVTRVDLPADLDPGIQTVGIYFGGLADIERVPIPRPRAVAESVGFLDNITLVPIPEPATLLFVLGGLGAGAAVRWRKRH